MEQVISIMTTVWKSAHTIYSVMDAKTIVIGVGILCSLPVLLPVVAGLLFFSLPVVLPVGLWLFVKRPDLVMRGGAAMIMWKMGFRTRYRITGGYTYCYAERGVANPDKPTLLFLHGFSADRDLYWPISIRIPKEWHMVSLDLPGHGNTTRNEEDSFTYEAQAERVFQFVRVMGLNRRPLHVIGCSMGGGVAGLYAAKYPKALSKLTLICPAGIHTDPLSDFEMDRKANILSPDLPDCEEAYAKVIPYFSYMLRHTKIPKTYLKGLAMMRRPSNKFFQKVLDEMMSSENRDALQNHMADITVPTQVLWGIYDRTLHPSGADILGNGIKNVQVHILQRCGHVFLNERPFKCAKLLLDFAEES